MSESFMKIMPLVFDLCTKICNYVNKCGVTKVGDTTSGAGAHKLDRYPFRKMRQSQEKYPFYRKILHNFLLIFFSMIDIEIFTYVGGRQGALKKIRKSQEQHPF